MQYLEVDAQYGEIPQQRISPYFVVRDIFDAALPPPKLLRYEQHRSSR